MVTMDDSTRPTTIIKRLKDKNDPCRTKKKEKEKLK